jgi:hypothetical protein
MATSAAQPAVGFAGRGPMPSGIRRASTRVESPSVAGSVALPVADFTGAELTHWTASVISVRHWRRLHNGALLAASPRVDWAALLRRTFEVDVLACPKCSGRMKILAVMTEPEAVYRILEHLRMPPDPTRPARARDPTDDLEGAGTDQST